MGTIKNRRHEAFVNRWGATVDLLMIPPCGLRRICRPVAARKTLSSCSAGGTRPDGSQDFLTMPGFPNGAPRYRAPRPSETKIQIGMLRADDASDGTADAKVEALHRIDVDGFPALWPVTRVRRSRAVFQRKQANATLKAQIESRVH
ncbi:MAG: hypothetical protein E5W15_18485 [Mesorhizobium sp.]|nr:MAG: hypothetical protein E5W15_18485 [Mesorhizobium sp.]